MKSAQYIEKLFLLFGEWDEKQADLKTGLFFAFYS